MKDEEGNVSYLALFGVYVLPILLVWGLYAIMQLPFDSDETTVARTKELEEHNAHERKKIENWI